MPASVRSEVIDNMLLKQLSTLAEPSASKTAKSVHPSANTGPCQPQVTQSQMSLSAYAQPLLMLTSHVVTQSTCKQPCHTLVEDEDPAACTPYKNTIKHTVFCL